MDNGWQNTVNNKRPSGRKQKGAYMRADEIRLAMARMKIATQKELASKAGITQQTLTAVMKERRVSLNTLEKLAGFLKISITKLML